VGGGAPRAGGAGAGRALPGPRELEAFPWRAGRSWICSRWVEVEHPSLDCRRILPGRLGGQVPWRAGEPTGWWTSTGG